MLHTLFSDGSDLTPLQMSLRAVAVFLLALLILRIAGRRTFGQHSAFDAASPSCWARR